ncbi:MAG: hypothetical protein QME21_16370 [Anaerolineales bacterium]|nr:hypothetical protein [Anaerolineales bacterium]
MQAAWRFSHAVLQIQAALPTHEIEGLVDLPPVHHSHPATIPPEVEQRILELSLEHPPGLGPQLAERRAGMVVILGW